MHTTPDASRPQLQPATATAASTPPTATPTLPATTPVAPSHPVPTAAHASPQPAMPAAPEAPLPIPSAATPAVPSASPSMAPVATPVPAADAALLPAVLPLPVAATAAKPAVSSAPDAAALLGAAPASVSVDTPRNASVVHFATVPTAFPRAEPAGQSLAACASVPAPETARNPVAAPFATNVAVPVTESGPVPVATPAAEPASKSTVAHAAKSCTMSEVISTNVAILSIPATVPQATLTAASAALSATSLTARAGTVRPTMPSLTPAAKTAIAPEVKPSVVSEALPIAVDPRVPAPCAAISAVAPAQPSTATPVSMPATSVSPPAAPVATPPVDPHAASYPAARPRRSAVTAAKALAPPGDGTATAPEAAPAPVPASMPTTARDVIHATAPATHPPAVAAGLSVAAYASVPTPITARHPVAALQIAHSAAPASTPGAVPGASSATLPAAMKAAAPAAKTSAVPEVTPVVAPEEIPTSVAAQIPAPPAAILAAASAATPGPASVPIPAKTSTDIPGAVLPATSAVAPSAPEVTPVVAPIGIPVAAPTEISAGPPAAMLASESAATPFAAAVSEAFPSVIRTMIAHTPLSAVPPVVSATRPASAAGPGATTEAIPNTTTSSITASAPTTKPAAALAAISAPVAGPTAAPATKPAPVSAVAPISTPALISNSGVAPVSTEVAIAPGAAITSMGSVRATTAPATTTATLPMTTTATPMAATTPLVTTTIPVASAIYSGVPAAPQHDSRSESVDSIESEEDSEGLSDDDVDWEIDVMDPSSSLREKFFTIADGVQCIGNFATAGDAPLPHPFLRIEGLSDPLAWPAPAAQVEQLLALPVAVPAPHGRGEETVIDKDVRDSHRVAPAHVSFCNPAWNAALSALTKTVCNKLGISGAVVAEFHNLLVYSTGGHFAKHKDSEKEAGMFGTLIVTQPSLHEGGALHVHHKGSDVVLESEGDGGSLGMRYAAFYADCEHELRRVKSGYRIALVYNLVRQGRSLSPLSAPDPCNDALLFRKFCAAWETHFRASLSSSMPSKLCYFLKHQYTARSLSWEALKGHDAKVAEALQEASCFDLFLILADYVEHYDEEYDEEVLDSEFKSDLWIQAPGQLLPASFQPHIRTSDFAQGEEYFSDVDPDDIKKEGYTGNEGCPCENWYHCTAIVLLPKTMRFAAADLPDCVEMLVRAVTRGERHLLCGYRDPNDALSICLQHKGWNSRLYEKLLRILPHKEIWVSHVRTVLMNVTVSDSTGDLFHVLFQEMVEQRGIWSLKDPILAMLQSAKNANSEGGVCASWGLIERMQRYACAQNTKDQQAIGSIAEVLVPNLSTVPGAQNGGNRYTDVRGWGCSLYSTGMRLTPDRTILAVFRCLHKLNRKDLLTKAMSNIRRNARRFNPCTDVQKALPEILQCNHGVITEDIKGLALSALSSMDHERGSRDSPDLGRRLRVLQPFGVSEEVIKKALKLPLVYPPLGSVFPAVIDLWKTSKVACTPSFPFYAGVIIRCVRDATKDESERTKQNVIKMGLVTLGEMDGMVTSDEMSSTSYQAQFAQALILRGELFKANSTIPSALLEMLGPNSPVSEEASDALLSHCITSLRRDVNAPLPKLKTWTVATPSSMRCNCLACKEAKTFLANPTASSTVLNGKEVTYRGHTTALLTQAAQRGAPFSVELLSTKQARVRGRLSITKLSAGQTPVRDIERLRGRIKGQSVDVALLKKLEGKHRKVAVVIDLDVDATEPSSKRTRLM